MVRIKASKRLPLLTEDEQMTERGKQPAEARRTQATPAFHRAHAAQGILWLAVTSVLPCSCAEFHSCLFCLKFFLS